jgi:hypothetical protein
MSDISITIKRFDFHEKTREGLITFLVNRSCEGASDCLAEPFGNPLAASRIPFKICVL